MTGQPEISAVKNWRGTQWAYVLTFEDGSYWSTYRFKSVEAALRAGGEDAGLVPNWEPK